MLKKNILLLLSILVVNETLAANFSDTNGFFITGYAVDEDTAIKTVAAHNALMQLANDKFILLHNEPPKYGFGHNQIVGTGLSEMWRIQEADSKPEDFIRALRDKDIRWWKLMKTARLEESQMSYDDFKEFVTTVTKAIDNSGNKKTILVGHSEGSVFTNQVVKKIIADRPDMKNCIGVVNVGGIASNVANTPVGSSWVTSTQDWVININPTAINP